MAIIKDKNIGIAAIPLSFKRDNPIPIDSSMVWYNFEAMQAYAASNPTAYVGQILSYVDAINNTSKAYIILDTAGNLEQLSGGVEGDYLPLSGGTMTGPIILEDGSAAASHTYVAEQIEAAGHLGRRIVEELPPVAEAKPNIIYMIKDESVTAGDSYREYLLIDGAFVQIGDTSVDMTNVARIANPPLAENMLVFADADGLLASTNITPEQIPVMTDTDNFISDELLEKVEEMPLIKSIGDGLTLENDGNLHADLLGVKIADSEPLPLIEGYVNIPLADSFAPGVIKGGENVSIQTDGTLNVERVNVNALYQDEGDWLIINGSDASGSWHNN